MATGESCRDSPVMAPLWEQIERSTCTGSRSIALGREPGVVPCCSQRWNADWKRCTLGCWSLKHRPDPITPRREDSTSDAATSRQLAFASSTRPKTIGSSSPNGWQVALDRAGERLHERVAEDPER